MAFGNLNSLALLTAGAMMCFMLLAFAIRIVLRARMATRVLPLPANDPVVQSKIIPELRDVYGHPLDEKRLAQGDWRWGDVMPLGARVASTAEEDSDQGQHNAVPSPQADTQGTVRTTTTTPHTVAGAIWSILPRRHQPHPQPIPKTGTAAHATELEITVAIAMPSPPSESLKHKLSHAPDESDVEEDSLDENGDGRVLDYVLGMARMPMPRGLDPGLLAV